MTTSLKLIRGGRGPEINDLSNTRLTPAQQLALDELQTLALHTNVIALSGSKGSGKSTVLRAFAQNEGGRLVTLDDLLEIIRYAHPRYWDAPLQEYLLAELEQTRILAIDGLHDIYSQLGGILQAGRPVSASYLVAENLYLAAERMGKTLVVCGPLPVGEETIHSVFLRGDLPAVELPNFGAADYEVIAASILGDAAAERIDFHQVLRFAAHLNGHQLRVAAGVVAIKEQPETQDFIDAVSGFTLTSNTKTTEVEQVSFATMPGMEVIAEQLERHIVLPITNTQLAEELDLKPKRGVLLYGPPGTGKTSVGRAMAHRLQGRFFLIDGSIRTEPAYAFLPQVQAIVAQAIENAPSVIFIDDADVLFGTGHIAGFTRYLLTLIDGLVSDSASKVCIMMTAMDASQIPQAVLRSGRVELWLETGYPDRELREKILKRWLGERLPGHETADYQAIAAQTEGFTPADLRRVAMDTRSLYAADFVRGCALADPAHYMRRAVEDLTRSRSMMALNLSDPSLRVG